MNEEERESKSTRKEVIAWVTGVFSGYAALIAWAAGAHTPMIVLACVAGAAGIYLALRDAE